MKEKIKACFSHAADKSEAGLFYRLEPEQYKALGRLQCLSDLLRPSCSDDEPSTRGRGLGSEDERYVINRE